MIVKIEGQVCVCVGERERQTDRHREKDRDRERLREAGRLLSESGEEKGGIPQCLSGPLLRQGGQWRPPSGLWRVTTIGLDRVWRVTTIGLRRLPSSARVVYGSPWVCGPGGLWSVIGCRGGEAGMWREGPAMRGRRRAGEALCLWGEAGIRRAGEASLHGGRRVGGRGPLKGRALLASLRARK